MSVQVDVQYAVPGGLEVPSAAQVQRWVAHALAGRRADAEVLVRIVDRREGALLNERYRGRAGPTNVLSFGMDLPAGVTVPTLGDVVICAPVAAEQALASNTPLQPYYAQLVVHGVLHLLGYDHEQAEEAEQMEKLEGQILQRLGYPDPYAVAEQTV